MSILQKIDKQQQFQSICNNSILDLDYTDLPQMGDNPSLDSSAIIESSESTKI